MELFLYSSTPLEDARDVLEDAIEEHLGHGAEITGGGSGIKGWNIDIDAVRDLEAPELKAFCDFLINQGVNSDAALNLYREGAPNRRIYIGEYCERPRSD